MPEDTGPWWVEDTETGHKFVAHSPAEHLKVLADESPYTAGGAFRPAEPAEVPPKSAKAKKESA